MKKKNLLFNELSIELTHKCILNCIFCSSSASENPIMTEEINFQRIKEIISECHTNYQIKSISLSGGEPLIYPFFFPLLEFILKKKLNVLIYTTGLFSIDNQLTEWPNSLIENFTKLTHRFKNDIHLVFDIQAPDKDNYEKITRKSGSYYKLIKTLNKIKDIKTLKKSAHFVPFKFNWKLIHETIRFCLSFNFENVKILRFVDQGRASNFTALDLNLEEFYLLQHNLEFLKKRYNNKLLLGHPIDFLFLINKERLIKSCRGGFDAPIILPNGNVYPCPAWKNINLPCAGNIYINNFTEIWTNYYFEQFRSFIKKDFNNIVGLCEDCKYIMKCKGKCVAQRILKYSTSPRLPDCLLIGPDPLCLRLREKKNYKDD